MKNWRRALSEKLGTSCVKNCEPLVIFTQGSVGTKN